MGNKADIPKHYRKLKLITKNKITIKLINAHKLYRVS